MISCVSPAPLSLSAPVERVCAGVVLLPGERAGERVLGENGKETAVAAAPRHFIGTRETPSLAGDYYYCSDGEGKKRVVAFRATSGTFPGAQHGFSASPRP